MGVTNAGFAGLCFLPGMIVSPATDDPVVLIGTVMGISGVVMLVCGALTLADRIKQAKKQKKTAEKQNRK
ncbi:MAG: hypothetical protein IKY52_09310 [Clostridia bacterium]|nr:hypothetical protein [Clostridia bacterium]